MPLTDIDRKIGAGTNLATEFSGRLGARDLDGD
jgi:hypothetical protein